MDYVYDGDFIKGIFLNRPNRFIAEVDIGYMTVNAHVANTGRMREILTPGKTVYLREARNKNRKTKFDLISIEHEGIFINLDSQLPNSLVEMAFLNNQIEGWEDIDSIKREVSVGDSRLDMLVIKDGRELYVEVKGVDLILEPGRASFPDAVTTRGTKHLRTLEKLVKEGKEAMNIYLIARKDAKDFRPNFQRDPVYAQTFYEVLESGVQARAYITYNCYNGTSFGSQIPIVSKGQALEEFRKLEEDKA